MATVLFTRGNCIPGHRRAFQSELRLRRSPHGRRNNPGASSTEVRIVVIETTLGDMKQDVSDVKKTQRTLLQVVDDKGAKYEDKFSLQLREFTEKLEPIQQSITDLQDSQKELRKDMQDSQKDLQNELQQIKWGGAFVVAVLSLFCSLFGNVSDKLPELGIALIVAVLVPVLLASAIAALILLWRKVSSSTPETSASKTTSAATS